MNNGVYITIKAPIELNEKLMRSAESENRTRHNYILTVLEQNENESTKRSFFDLKFTKDEKERIKKGLGI